MSRNPRKLYLSNLDESLFCSCTQEVIDYLNECEIKQYIKKIFSLIHDVPFIKSLVIWNEIIGWYYTKDQYKKIKKINLEQAKKLVNDLKMEINEIILKKELTELNDEFGSN